MIPWSLLRAMGSMLQSQTTLLAMFPAESIAITSAFLLFFLVCAVALLQSRLIKAARHWTQHGASAIQSHSSGSLPRTRTSAAELYYLRYMRSCAATAFGNKGGGTSHSIPLQMSGADFIARLLHSICQQVCLSIIRHSVRLLLMPFLPLARLLQSIRQRVELSMASLAMIPYTPLELAACAHVTNACMQLDFFTYAYESNHCWVSAVTEPSAQEIATTALALGILSLSAIDWHVPRWLPRHQLLCQILTAMCMQMLRMDSAYTTLAFLLPTFGKRPRDESHAAR